MAKSNKKDDDINTRLDDMDFRIDKIRENQQELEKKIIVDEQNKFYDPYIESEQEKLAEKMNAMLTTEWWEIPLSLLVISGIGFGIGFLIANLLK